MSEAIRNDRNLGALDFFLLWVGAAISLAEIWAGGLLVPLGLVGGLLAILLGHVIGNTPMALGGMIGSRHGVPAMISTRGALGIRGSYLPAGLNIIQLVGWTAVMLWICGHTAARLAPDAGWLRPTHGMVIAGILTTLWALSGHQIWKWLQRGAVTLLAVLSALMTWTVFRNYGLAQLLNVRPTGDLSFGRGLDLVIAMPISWLPLVSDYSRFARDTKGCFWGTWWGYLLAGSWMYAVGLWAALASRTTTPDAMVMNLMAQMGWMVPALLIILLSTVTTTFLDIYSNAVSARSIAPRLNERLVIVLTGLLGTLLAVLFPASNYEGFLLLIGAMFCPLLGVVLADYFVLNRLRYDAESLFGGPRYVFWKGIHVPAFIAWAAGFALYQWASRRGWTIGASLPGLLGAAAIYLLVKGIRSPFSSSTPPSTINRLS